MTQILQTQELARLAALKSYDILDTPAEPKFDRIVRLASRLLETPISVVSLIDEARQWFKAKIGIDGAETPRSVAFCDHAIRTDAVMVVEDATRDPRFLDNPLVTADPHIRFYAGAPLRTDDGFNLGTLCVIDRVPRQITTEQQSVLADLAGLVVDEMELRKAMAILSQLAVTDPMTGLFNRRRFFAAAETEWNRASRHGRPLSLLILDIDRFKSINDRYGHDVGDQVIVQIARQCTLHKRTSDIIARIGGEEFTILMPETDIAGGLAFADRLRDAIECVVPASIGLDLAVTISVGITQACPGDAIEDVMKRADLALYEAKNGGRNTVRQR